MKNKTFECDMCEDTGVIYFDEQDSDGNWQRAVGSRACNCQVTEPEYEQEE